MTNKPIITSIPAGWDSWSNHKKSAWVEKLMDQMNIPNEEDE